MSASSGGLTENGRFYQTAKQHKQVMPGEIINAYEKIKAGIWVYIGLHMLTYVWIESSGDRYIFKFKLVMPDESAGSDAIVKSNELELEHNRRILTSVKNRGLKRDKGKCVKCGSSARTRSDPQTRNRWRH